MTGNVFFDAVIIFLITYAILNILYEITDFFIERFAKCYPRDFLILSLEHGTETMECDVRTAIRRSCDLKCALLIVDNGLDSSEKMMLWRLTDDQNNIVYSVPEELSEHLKTAEMMSKTL